jgi:hypothetical protein
MKRYRDITYGGGDSSKQAQAEMVTQTRFKLVTEASDGCEAVYEPYTVKTKRHEASWVACFKMEVAADILVGRRPHKRQMAEQDSKRKALKAHKDAQRDKTKTETLAEVDRRVTKIAAGVDHRVTNTHADAPCPV